MWYYKNQKIRTYGGKMEREKVIEKVSPIVKKDNRLIEGRYDVTAVEYKLILFFMSFIDEADLVEDDFPVFKIPVSLILEEMGQKENYTYVKEAVERLMRRVITFERVNEKGKKEFTKYALISKAKYVEGSATVEVQIHRDLVPFYRKLKERYTKIPLKPVFSMKSKYSIRLYELLKQFESTGYRIDSLEDLRFYLAIEKNEYKRFESFERKVIQPAVSEISEKTDITVSYRKIKRGRKVAEIEFIITPKAGIAEKGSHEAHHRVSILDIEKTAIKMFEIAKARREYREAIEKIYTLGGKDRIKKNEILFLLLNSGEDEKITINKIAHAVKNKAVRNPFGLLLSVMDIDIEKARYKELLNSDLEVEVEFFKELSENYELQREEDIENIIEAVKEVIEKHPEGKSVIGMVPFMSTIAGSSVFLVPLDRESALTADYIKDFEEEISYQLKKRGYRFYVV